MYLKDNNVGPKTHKSFLGWRTLDNIFVIQVKFWRILVIKYFFMSSPKPTT